MTFDLFSRRTLLYGFVGGAAAIFGQAVARSFGSAGSMKPGDFIWEPERSPSGPVAIIVSLPEQLVHVYRNGIEIGISTCSTGKKGHRTPTGVFTILQKDKHHRSSTYNNAPMPNMNRLTWKGIALHAGNLPGYPASHGCVRLPMAFSEDLFSVTHVGTPVIIADNHSAPRSIVHPGQVLSSDAKAEFAHVADTKKKTPAHAQPAHQVADADIPTPHLNPHRGAQPATGQAAEAAAPAAEVVAAAPVVPATTILISSIDQRIIVLDNGAIVAEGKATITEPEQPLGHHVFVLSDVDATDGHLHWHTIAYGHGVDASAEAAELTTINRIQGDHDVIEAIRTRMHSGTMMVTVDQTLHEDTRSDDGFVVIDAQVS